MSLEFQRSYGRSNYFWAELNEGQAMLNNLRDGTNYPYRALDNQINRIESWILDARRAKAALQAAPKPWYNRNKYATEIQVIDARIAQALRIYDGLHEYELGYIRANAARSGAQFDAMLANMNARASADRAARDRADAAAFAALAARTGAMFNSGPRAAARGPYSVGEEGAPPIGGGSRKKSPRRLRKSPRTKRSKRRSPGRR